MKGFFKGRIRVASVVCVLMFLSFAAGAWVSNAYAQPSGKPPRDFWSGMSSFWWLVVGLIFIVETLRKLGYLKDPTQVQMQADITEIKQSQKDLRKAHQVGAGFTDGTQKGNQDPIFWCQADKVVSLLTGLKTTIERVDARAREAVTVSTVQMESVVSILEAIADTQEVNGE